MSFFLDTYAIGEIKDAASYSAQRVGVLLRKSLVMAARDGLVRESGEPTA